MALARLKSAGDFLKKNLYSAFYEELHKALLGFVSDKMNISVEDLSKENISEMLAENGVTEELAKRLVDLIDACEYARYSPDGGHEAMNTHYNEAVDVISAIDSMMKGKKKNIASKTAVTIVALMLTLPGVVRANADVYLDSLWQKGTAAYTEGNWRESLDSWKAVENTGVVSPELYYNIGNSYFKSGDYAHAILYNLEFANSLIQDKIDVVPEFILKNWARKISYLLSSNVWAVLSLVLLAAALAMLLIFLLGNRRGLRRAGFYSAIVLLLLSAGTFGFSAWQRSDYMKADYAIIISPVSSAKSSPSAESSKDLFVLHEGTKVKILDSVGVWKNISLSDGRQGWIQESDMEII